MILGETLLRSGFQFIGEWTQDPQSAIALNAKAPVESGVYVFVVGDTVEYVGLINCLRTRFAQYRGGHAGQCTSAWVNKLINKALSDGQRVKILVATSERDEWRGLSVNIAAGLEAGLIQMGPPLWNIHRGRAHLAGAHPPTPASLRKSS